MARQSRWRWRFALVAAVLVVGLAALAYMLAEDAGMDRLAGQLRDRLTLSQRAVESEIERFAYLPQVLGEDERILELLAHPSTNRVREVNLYLQTVAGHAQADVVYIIDPSGLTLSSSNWSEPSSFVGHNYSFRPYFADALVTGRGAYYAVGVTTGVPGYFLSSRIDGPEGPLGVAVVKVDMSPLERVWAEAGEMTGVADASGIVFLSGVPGWRYRPLHQLADMDRARILAERRYDGIDVAARRPLVPGSAAADLTRIFEDGAQGLALSTIVIDPEGWHHFSALPLAPVREEARLIAGIAGLLSLVCLLAGLYGFQRRQLTRFRLNQKAMLEERVAERTSALGREIEERKRAEAELRKTQDSLIHAAKLAALGRMSAAIVHEVSQPLSALDNTLAAAALHAQRGDEPKSTASITTGRDLLKRMQRTIKHLKTFSSRAQALPSDPIALAQSVTEAIEIAAPRARERGVTLRFEPCELSPLTAANAVRIEQVFINLLLNAIDATASMGNSQVLVRLQWDETRAAVHFLDSGPGIPSEIAEQIIEPFFTTKATGEGLGLGLSISRAILEDYGGSLVFSPAAGGGTCATVWLPAAIASRSLELAR
ncbi:two-component system, NtrC family, C4-dicarboxylate transport sensor histidine kinase DctB [Devosia crocina]|uniref:histidine kinase n=1 Tax=Devosia crocina TaxID=429728 RepID=A0A1I7MZF7_9HYPH|nr:ATP-binding protein [Devosia crocina]SFV27791.1 two-component system, NtrC family, C4-dicarboxylate transport sensor histidine kinase DctB [Devosia crocina]